MLSVGCLKENNDIDFRVSLTPETSKKLIEKDINVFIQENCGLRSGFNNEDYEKVGAKLLNSSQSVIESSDILLSISPLDIKFEKLPNNINSKIFIGNFNFKNNIPDERFTFLALEKIPRNLTEASHDLGVGPLQTFWNVILPLSMPGVIAGMTFTFCLASGDFVAPMLVGGPDGFMIANLMTSQFGAAMNWPLGSALAMIMLAVVLTIISLSDKFQRAGRVELG